MRLTTTTLAALATLALGDDMEIPESMNASLAEAIREAQAERRAAKQKEAALMILDLTESVEQAKSIHRSTLRKLRQQEKQYKETLNKIDRALDYGMATSNFIPILALLGHVTHYSVKNEMTAEQWQKVSTVPEDWAPPAKEE